MVQYSEKRRHALRPKPCIYNDPVFRPLGRELRLSRIAFMVFADIAHGVVEGTQHAGNASTPVEARRLTGCVQLNLWRFRLARKNNELNMRRAGFYRGRNLAATVKPNTGG
jgi:hypothetical protein